MAINKELIKRRVAQRLDFNENHDERGRFSFGDGGAGGAAGRMKGSIEAHHVHASASELGGKDRASVHLHVSLDPKETWQNGIKENSRHAHFSLTHEGKLTQIASNHVAHMRAATVKSPEEAVGKINKWAASNHAAAEAERSVKLVKQGVWTPEVAARQNAANQQAQARGHAPKMSAAKGAADNKALSAALKDYKTPGKLSPTAQRTNDRIAQSRESLKAGAAYENAKQMAAFKDYGKKPIPANGPTTGPGVSPMKVTALQDAPHISSNFTKLDIPGTAYKHNASGAVIAKVNGTWRVDRPDGKGSLGGNEDMYRHEHLERAMHDVHERSTGLRMDFNENHDERGRFSVGDTVSVSSDKGAVHGMGTSHYKVEETSHKGNANLVKLRAVDAKGKEGSMTRAAFTNDLKKVGAPQAVSKPSPGRFSHNRHDPYAGRDTGKNWREEAKARVAAKEASFKAAREGAAKDVQDRNMAAHDKDVAKGRASYQTVKGGLQSGSKGGQSKGKVLNPSAKEFEHHVQNSNFSVLTAANPMSQTTDSGQNAKRMQQLYHELHESGAHYIPTVGKYGSKEPSIMVMHENGFSKEAAEKLGQKYGQTSVMHSLAGKGLMHYTNGPRAGKEWESKGKPTFNPKATDYYTGHQGNRFSYEFPDEAFPNEKGE